MSRRAFSLNLFLSVLVLSTIAFFLVALATAKFWGRLISNLVGYLLK